MEEIIEFRKDLHRYPELSGKEINTSKKIKSFFDALKPDLILELGKTGLAIVFEGENPEQGKNIMFRAELDALPILETNSLEYNSAFQGIAHLCGHDGHMASLLRLGTLISKIKLKKGKATLLFQPAEETGQGALELLEDPNWKKIEPDYIYAYHNIPGQELHSVLLKNNSFASASKGITIKFHGKTSHAAEPENGINPAKAISKIVLGLNDLKDKRSHFSDMVLITVVHIHLGEIAFGTSAGYAELRVTLRAYREVDMKKLTELSEKLIRLISKEEKLEIEIDYSEEFPSTYNTEKCVEVVRASAESMGYKTKFLDNPFKWSEDFGYYSKQYECAFFGIGSGVNQEALHNPKFDFPDELIESSSNLFFSILKFYNN